MGIVTGLASEVRVIEHLLGGLPEGCRPPLVACAGASSRRAASMAKDLVEQGARSLLSFGVAGGLDPNLKPGDIVLANIVIPPQGLPYACDAEWRGSVTNSAATAGHSLIEAPLAGSNEVVPNPAAKAALFSRSGAVAVDMESHTVAIAAAAARVPLLALRVVTDTADSSIPGSVIGSVDEKGEPDWFSFWRRLALRPLEARQVARLRRDAKTAHAALRGLKDLSAALFGVA